MGNSPLWLRATVRKAAREIGVGGVGKSLAGNWVGKGNCVCGSERSAWTESAVGAGNAVEGGSGVGGEAGAVWQARDRIAMRARAGASRRGMDSFLWDGVAIGENFLVIVLRFALASSLSATTRQ